MDRMDHLPSLTHALLALALCVGLGPASSVHAQQAQQPPPQQRDVVSPGDPQADEVELVLEPGQRPRLRLAMPAAQRPVNAPPEARAAMDSLEETLRNDLDFTGVFRIQGPDVLKILTLTGDRRHDFVQYASLDNEVVLLNEIKRENDKLVLEGRVYDLKSGRFIFGKRYQGTYDLVRRIAHTFSDEIVLYFTGRPGISRSQVSFSSDRDVSGNKEIYMMDYDGAGQRRVTAHDSLTLAPVWSPRNDVLAYISYYEDGPSIYAADIETGRKSPILADEQSTFSPTFSPDGRHLAFTRSVRGNMEIYRCTRDRETNQCSEPRRLTNSGGIDTNPAWSPNGREIAFTSSRSGTPQIYLIDAEGMSVRRLTFDGTYNEGAAWHPDSTKIAFSHRDQTGSRFDIAVLDLVTLEMTVLTEGVTGSHEGPTFSPDGRFLAFESTRGGGRQIFVMEANGNNLRQLTRSGNNYGPAWSNYLQ